mgnify:CR=1 FL=1
MKNETRNDFKDIRDIFISKNPFCQYCGKKADHVHHIIPISKGGDNRESNLISLCVKCHGLIHNVNFMNPEELKKRQKEGIEKAKKEGKFKGGQIKQLNKNLYLQLKQKYLCREINKTQFAELLGVSRPTLNNILKKEEEYLKVFK